ncbi:Trehalase [Toxocara canis]|uniref:Trehalase n=1 Tax=Toxocara canis TaxID=6265 RepID=A0A0B2W325_TOXCA|nr:Trehalase [Toxocara canis]
MIIFESSARLIHTIIVIISYAVVFTTATSQRQISEDRENFDELKYPPTKEIPSIYYVIHTSAGLPENACNSSDSPASIIYCEGKLLHAVMMLHLYLDSKTFVDKPLKKSPKEVAEAFEKKFPDDIKYGDREVVRAFLDENFEKVGQELSECKLPDWQPRPPKLLAIRNRHLRKFALDINRIWSRLCRKMKKEVYDCLYETTRAMLGNFKHMIDEFGFVPNGGRIYYKRRSQPPFFIPMVLEYYKATKDKEFLASFLPTMQKVCEIVSCLLW